MKKALIFIFTATLLLGMAASTLSQNWEMTDVPLSTPWAEDVDPDNVLPEYPRPVMERGDWLNLNGIWQFQQASPGDPVPIGKELSDQILVPFPWESALSGVRKEFDTRRAWYKRTFTIPSAWKGQKVLLQFGAVDWQAEVYVNGRCVGTHKGGFDAFFFDITDFLKPKGNQEIIVGVWDPGSDKAIATGKQSNNRFADPHGYSYCPASGIWQTVWLEPVPENHIIDYKANPNIDQEILEITVNPSLYNQGVTAHVKVLDGDKVVGEGSGTVNLPFRVEVPDPKLWSPDTPFLYDLEISLMDTSVLLDRVKGYTGMRKISIELDGNLQKIYLNNKFLFQMGPLDQGFWPDGIYTAPTDEALRWDVEEMKEFGYNMVRKHIKIEPQRWFYWCDKLGLIVWQDMPSTWKIRTEAEKDQFETELARMVRTHINHPSIVNWIVFNEHWGLYDTERLTTAVMQLDPSRLVTGNSGIDAGRPDIDYEVGHIKDNHSYRPPNCAFANDKRAVVCGEYGAIGYLFEGHVWDTDGPWVHYNYEGKDAATDEYERFVKMLINFKKEGLSAAVYTQWTDLENEMNGIYTYDRKVIKLHKERVKEANESTYK